MPTIILKKDAISGMLTPVHEDGEEWLNKKKPGAHFKANMKSSRNPDHHRKGFALLKLVMDNHPTYTAIEDVLIEFKLRSGHYVEHIRPGNSKAAASLRGYIQHWVPMMNEDQATMLKLIDRLEHEAKLVYMPKSIAFDEMGQEEFEEIYEKWIDIAVAHFSQRGDSARRLDDIRRQIAEF